MPDLDAPHWSWLHGCRKHRGQPAPCKECLRLRDPDVTRDGTKLFHDVKPPKLDDEDNSFIEYLNYLAGTNP